MLKCHRVNDTVLGYQLPEPADTAWYHGQFEALRAQVDAVVKCLLRPHAPSPWLSMRTPGLRHWQFRTALAF
jgi:hypothetical protein